MKRSNFSEIIHRSGWVRRSIDIILSHPHEDYHYVEDEGTEAWGVRVGNRLWPKSSPPSVLVNKVFLGCTICIHLFMYDLCLLSSYSGRVEWMQP